MLKVSFDDLVAEAEKFRSAYETLPKGRDGIEEMGEFVKNEVPNSQYQMLMDGLTIEERALLFEFDLKITRRARGAAVPTIALLGGLGNHGQGLNLLVDIDLVGEFLIDHLAYWLVSRR